MATTKPIVKKVRGGYTVSFGPCVTRVQIKKSANQREGLHATTKLNGKEIANLNGTTIGEVATFNKISPLKGLPKETSLKALLVIVPSVELALKKAGINHIGASTDPVTARIYKKIGYTVSSRGKPQDKKFMKFLKYDMGYKLTLRSTIADLQKDLLKSKPMFAAKPKKAAKKPVSKRRRRR